jgi:uncharacterized protein YndB with AHSA1/START domain
MPICTFTPESESATLILLFLLNSMPSLNYHIEINAPIAHVWEVMLNDASYRVWTATFHAGSYFTGDWSEGSEMRFIGPSETGEGGMLARVKSNIPNEFISLEMYGELKDGVVQPWPAGQLGYENYTFKATPHGTELAIELTFMPAMPPGYQEMFDDMWPKALQVLKALAEDTK